MNGCRIPVERGRFREAAKVREMAGVDFHLAIEQGRPAEFVEHDHDNMGRMFCNRGLFNVQGRPLD